MSQKKLGSYFRYMTETFAQQLASLCSYNKQLECLVLKYKSCIEQLECLVLKYKSCIDSFFLF